jgi:hypothetical protein
VFLEQLQELFLKGHLLVVLRLPLDVLNAQSQPSLRDLYNAEPAFPTLKRWAILGMSLRGKFMLAPIVGRIEASVHTVALGGPLVLYRVTGIT